jgi:hypothetical protein
MKYPTLLLTALLASATQAADYSGFDPVPGAGHFHYFTGPAPSVPPSRALVVMHGHPRDAQRTLEATEQAVAAAGQSAETLIVAPQFQVPAHLASGCSLPGAPAAGPDELLWDCRSWVEGAPASNQPAVSAYAVLDALVAHLQRQWPSLRQITVAGFSAGGQMVQHYIGYAAPAPAGIHLRYVVASPGSWLYFDAQSPNPRGPACPEANRWRYGTNGAPAWLARDSGAARQHYADADVGYLVGALDASDGPGTFYRILDKSCGALRQGPFRAQRAQAYAAYDARALATRGGHRLRLVPGCAHDVGCVFPAAAARRVLLGD